MIDIGEILVQFHGQVLGLFLLEELRACSDGSRDFGLPMDSVRFHATPAGDETIGRDFFLIIELMSAPVAQQKGKGGVRRPSPGSIRMTKTSNNPC